MKTYIIPLFMLLLTVSCNQIIKKQSDPQLLKQLKTLSEEQNYFKLKHTFETKKTGLSESHVLYFDAIIKKVFNQPAESNITIERILNNNDLSLDDTLINKLYGAKLGNHINLYEYAEAASTSELIQKNYLSLNDSSNIKMLQNEIKIWNAIKDVPKQQIIKNSDCSIPMFRDKVGLFNVDVKMGDSTVPFLFDTGANFSAIKRSLVGKLGLTLIESDFYVTAATGLKVKSDIAIADELILGEIICRNVVFLVLNDEDLSFPQVDYYPNGAVGFPVIEAFDEIRINKENQIFIPQTPVKYSFDNFALDGLMPILACNYQDDTLSFHFDTGASKTSLFPRFYKDYKSEIENKYEKHNFKASSGGGMVEFTGYEVIDLPLKVADSEAILKSVNLHIKDLGGEESNFHGNFGQDYIKQFDEMILSFKHSSVLFR